MHSFQINTSDGFYYRLIIGRDVTCCNRVGNSHVNLTMLEIISPNAEGLSTNAANVGFFSRMKCGVNLQISGSFESFIANLAGEFTFAVNILTVTVHTTSTAEAFPAIRATVWKFPCMLA